MRKYFSTAIILCLCFSCNQSKRPEQAKTNSEDSIRLNITGSMEEPYRIVLIEPGQRFTVSASGTSLITGKKGLKITVDPTALEAENGAPLGDKVEVELKEITNQEALFKNDAPTISNGRLLVSGGAYYIEMNSGGNKLKIKENKTLKIQLPKISSSEMQLFYGQRDSSGILNWIEAGEKFNPILTTRPINKSKTVVTGVSKPVEKKEKRDSSDLEKLLAFADKNNGKIATRDFDSLTSNKRVGDENIDFSRKVTEIIDTLTGKKVTEVETTYYNPVEIKGLGWINCDRYDNRPIKSEIICELDSSLNTPMIAVYIIFRSQNALVKEFIVKNKNKSSYKLNNLYPQGEAVNLIAIAKVDGKYYSYKTDLFLKKEERINFKFTETTNIETVKNSFRF